MPLYSFRQFPATRYDDMSTVRRDHLEVTTK